MLRCFRLALLSVLVLQTAPACAQSENLDRGQRYARGNNWGIGAELDSLGDEVWVGSLVMPGGAYAAGLRPGSSIIAIDGRSTAELKDRADDYLWGPPQSKVDLKLLDGRTITLTRDLSEDAALKLWTARFSEPGPPMQVNEPESLAKLEVGMMAGDDLSIRRLLKFFENYPGPAGLRWNRHAAEAGYVEPMANLAEAYITGIDVPRNDAKALNWYKEAHARGEWKGDLGLLRLYQEHRWPSADPALVEQLYVKAVEGWPQSFQTSQGKFYEQRQDLVRAAACYRKSLELGDRSAALALAKITTDPREAVAVLEKALGGPSEEERNEEDQQVYDALLAELGARYEAGVGTAKNPAAAAAFYVRSGDPATSFRGANLHAALGNRAASLAAFERGATELVNAEVRKARFPELGSEWFGKTTADKQALLDLIDRAGAAGSGEADAALAAHTSLVEEDKAFKHSRLVRAAGHGHPASLAALALEAKAAGKPAVAERYYRQAAAALAAHRPDGALREMLQAQAAYDAAYAMREEQKERGAFWDPAAVARMGTPAQANVQAMRRPETHGTSMKHPKMFWQTRGLLPDERQQRLLGSLYECKAELVSPAESRAWHKLAAEAGDPTGQLRYGAACELEGNLVEATFWYMLAAASRISEAGGIRDRAYARLNSGQQLVVQDRASIWWMKNYR